MDRGKAKKGDEVEIIGLRETRKSVITGTEMFHKELDEVVAGDNAGILLRGIEREDVERGQVLAKPGSITPHKKFLAQVYVLKKEEGGTAQGVLHGLSAAVLHSDDGCDREYCPAGGSGDGDAWGQRQFDGGVDCAGGVGAGFEVCYPRRWLDRRLRRRHQNLGINYQGS